MKRLSIVIACLTLTACAANQSDQQDRPTIHQHHWTQIAPPDGCIVKQIAADHMGGFMLCEDGRVFH